MENVSFHLSWGNQQPGILEKVGISNALFPIRAFRLRDIFVFPVSSVFQHCSEFVPFLKLTPISKILKINHVLNRINLSLPLYLQVFQAATAVLFWSAHPTPRKTLPELTSWARTGQPFFLQLSRYGLITLSVTPQPDQNGPWLALWKGNTHTQFSDHPREIPVPAV